MRRRTSHSSLSPLGSSGLILKRAPYFGPAADASVNKLDVDASPWKNLRTRTVFGLMMIVALYCVLMAGPVAIVAGIVLIQTLVFKEVISIAHMRSKEKQLPWFRTITWYFLFCTNYFLYGESFVEHFKRNVYADAFLSSLAQHHRFISFCLYMFGMMLFVLNLRKGHYKFQFGQLAFTHMALLLVVIQSHFIVRNIFDGLIWFILPIALVTCNDISAYFFGRLFGKTPLIKVSPRKTWEGFIGGFATTVLFGFFFSGYLAQFPSVCCPIDSMFSSPLRSGATCTVGYLFQKTDYHLPPMIVGLCKHLFGVRIKSIEIYPVQWHSLAFSCFASAIAPFGGFFASGFKRAFKLKDFSDSIPGHGGVADRVDCQIVNGLFAYLYLTSFIKPVSMVSVGGLLEAAVKGLTSKELLGLYFGLQDYLLGQGLLPDLP